MSSSTEIATFDSSRGSMATITGGHLDSFREWSRTIAQGAVIPDALRGKPADVFVTVMHGLDLGLRPMQALNLVYVVKGRPSLSAEGMRSLLLDRGHEFEVVTCTAEKAVVRGRRAGSETWHEAEFTDAQRKRASLSGANWNAYPEDMLLARATTRLCKRYFPDVTNGLSSVEEILDEQGTTASPSLADAAAERERATGASTTAAPVDDQAEAARLQAEVDRIAAEHARSTEPVDAEVVPDVQDVPAGFEDWPEAATPGGKR